VYLQDKKLDILAVTASFVFGEAALFSEWFSLNRSYER